MQHYFINQNLTLGDQIKLPNDIAHHFVKVMRAVVGDQLELVSEKNQTLFVAKLIDADNHIVQIIENKKNNVELPVNVTIVSGLAKQSKPELIVQKATELGVHRIIFLPMQRSIVKWNQKSVKKISRLQEVAQSAAEQSHRNVIPKVDYLADWDALFQESFDQKIVAYEEVAKQGETAALVKVLQQIQPNETIVSVFGPEGGLTDTEVNKLVDHDYIAAGLGPRILRTETAPLYFLSAVSVMLELMRN